MNKKQLKTGDTITLDEKDKKILDGYFKKLDALGDLIISIAEMEKNIRKGMFEMARMLHPELAQWEFAIDFENFYFLLTKSTV